MIESRAEPSNNIDVTAAITIHQETSPIASDDITDTTLPCIAVNDKTADEDSETQSPPRSVSYCDDSSNNGMYISRP